MDKSQRCNYASVIMKKKDLATLGAVATIGGAIVALHGITSKRWKEAHTVFVVASLVVVMLTWAQSQG